MKRSTRWLIRLIKLGIIASLLGFLGLLGSYAYLAPELPDVNQLREVKLQVPLRIYSSDGKLLSVFGEKRRLPVQSDGIPANLVNAFIAGEDERFFSHPGVDHEGILRAVWHIVKTGEKGPGGSTITMQLARNFFLSFEQTYTRKLREIFLALKIERALSKHEILELYLNKIYLGNRAYGVAAAAQIYYGKRLAELSLAESAMIASLPKAPSRINPINNPERALIRRNYVLGRMLDLGYISKEQYKNATEERDTAFSHGPVVEFYAPYVAEMVRSQLLDLYGQNIYTDGLSARTTIDSKLQKAAQDALRKGLVEYDRRHGYRGAEKHMELPLNSGPDQWKELLMDYEPLAGLMPGLVLETTETSAIVYLRAGETVAIDLAQITWARPFIDQDRKGPTPKVTSDILKPGDIIRLSLRPDGQWELAQLPKIQGALVSMEPRDGRILALAGGFDFALSKFNRASQAQRQPGSNFKPVVYSAALEKGYTAATLINDAPVVINDPALERQWKPENYSQKFYGPTRLREALIRSRNLVSIRILRDIGTRYTVEYASRFGFDPDSLSQDLSLALGSITLTPLQMATAYSVLANGGYLVQPYLLEHLVDDEGRQLYQSQALKVCPADLTGNHSETPDNRMDCAPQTLDPDNVYIITSIMKDVIRRGTGRRALSLGRSDLAGKTGTTNDQRDAWFSGFSPDLVTTAWVGFDDFSPLGKGEVGGRAALPIWIDFMQVALKDRPERNIPVPDSLVLMRIDPETGKPAAAGNPDAITEIFRPKYAPNPGDTTKPGKEQIKDPYEVF